MKTSKAQIQIAAKKMLEDIDASANRTISAICLEYNKAALNFIIKNELVTIIGDKITRRFHGKDTSYLVFNF